MPAAKLIASTDNNQDRSCRIRATSHIEIPTAEVVAENYRSPYAL